MTSSEFQKTAAAREECATSPGAGFFERVLAIDPRIEAERLQRTIRTQVLVKLRRRGVVVGLSGGIDSSVVAALSVRALGEKNVLGLLMPERESSSDSLRLGDLAAKRLGIDTQIEEIGSILESAGCYRRRDDAIRTIIPDYGSNWRCKIVLPNMLDTDSYALYSVVAKAPDGAERRARLSREAYLAIVAATNFKQRTRKMLEYYWADRLQYAVAGTPNCLEYVQGFFVKSGDGAADLKPIAHLYKGQVYRLAEYLGIPDEICKRPPTTDTYSLPQSQEEFYFSIPWNKMDVCLYAKLHQISPDTVTDALGMSEVQVRRIFRLIEGQQRAAEYLHSAPLLPTSMNNVGSDICV